MKLIMVVMLQYIPISDIIVYLNTAFVSSISVWWWRGVCAKGNINVGVLFLLKKF